MGFLDSIGQFVNGSESISQVGYSPMDATGEVSGGTTSFESSPSIMSSVMGFLKDLPLDEQAKEFANISKLLKNIGGMQTSMESSPLLQKMMQQGMSIQRGQVQGPPGGIQVPNDAGPDMAARILKSAGLA